MAFFQSLILLFFGGGFLVVAWRGHQEGELPAGAKGFEAYRPSRRSSPGAFYFHLLLYIAFGSGLVVYGLMIMVGAAEPIPLAS
ncbi:MAG: hypothetical protein R3174_10635 [Gammaproteobacteria bacterium]|nr:hypothetical protein [Gammaproteobacteria bacterium]